jgi:hypothetical protein
MHANQMMNPAASLGEVSGGNRPQSTLESAMGSTHNAAGELAKAIDMLSARLQGVLAPSVPTPQGQTKGIAAVEAPHSPAVNDLHVLRGRLEALTFAVNDMTGRLEA